MQNKVPRCSAGDLYQPTQLKTTIGDVGLPWVKIIDDHIWMDNKDTIKKFVAKLIHIYIFHAVLHIIILTVLKLFDSSRQHKKVLQVHPSVSLFMAWNGQAFGSVDAGGQHIYAVQAFTGRIASDVRFLMRQKENPSLNQRVYNGKFMDILC